MLFTKLKNSGNSVVLLAVLFFLTIPSLLSAQTTARGKLLHDGKPVADARVIIKEIRKAFYTDKNGMFTFTVPDSGFYTFRILIDDKLFQQRKRVQFNDQLITFYSGEVKKKLPSGNQVSNGGGGIQVVGRKDQTKLSRYRLSNEEIKRLPGVYGDSLKAVETLPGVTPAPPIGVLPSVNILSPGGSLGGLGLGAPYSNSISGILVMRGAGSRSSSFFLDDFKIQYPFHLGDQSSVINNDYIRNVDVYTGTYPVRYGNATGGVIAVTGPDKVKKFKGHINIALFLTDVYFQDTLFDNKAYYVATARQSYPNYTLLTVYPNAIPANAKYANYKDGQFKIGFRPNNNHEFTMIYFGARDILQYSQEVANATNSNYSSGSNSALEVNTNGNSRPPVGLDRGFHTQGFKYTYQHAGKFVNTMLLQVSRFQEDFELDFRSGFTGERIFSYEVVNARQEIQYRNESSYELIKNHLLVNVGLEANINRWELSMANLLESPISNPNSPDFTETINDLIANDPTFRALFDGDRTEFDLNSAYAELEIQFWRFRLTPGIRSEYFSLSGSTAIGPRMGVEFNIKETGTTLLLGAGRHFSLPPTLEQVSIEAGNPHLSMEESDHVAGGIEQKIGRLWTVKVEAYRNVYRNLVVADSFNIIPFSPRLNKRELVNKNADIAAKPLENRSLGYSNDGTGYSTGVEFLIKKTRPPGSSGVFGWLSYGYSITKRNNHQPRLSNDEQAAYVTRQQNREVHARLDVGRDVLLYYNTGGYEYFRDNDRDELYDLDRTHSISLVLNYKFNRKWQIGGRWKYATNLPYTPITGNQDVLAFLGRPTFISEYSEYFNSDRLGPTHQLDLRLDYFWNYQWGSANYFVELINVYGRKNPESESFDFLYPYVRHNNPAIAYDSTYFEFPIGKGRRIRLPLINIGMEISF